MTPRPPRSTRTDPLFPYPSLFRAEVPVTRGAVQLDYGAVGFGYVMGRNKRHAELAATVDAMLQTPSRRDALERAIIAPLTLRLEARRQARSRKAAATKVEFFTMVRGD